MLSISAPRSASEAADYYAHLNDDPARQSGREDYYSADAAGQWMGSGAEAMGLNGDVDRQAFLDLAKGNNPAGGSALTQKPGDHHRAGWDLTFSADKSVSSVWARASEQQRQAIEAAHQKAVTEALKYIEDTAAFSRRGSGASGASDESRREEAKLIVASYRHGTNRNQDPQLHTHAFVFNVTIRQDGSTGALDPRSIYQHKMAAGAAYRAALAHELGRQGYGIEAGEKGTFKLTGVPENLTKFDSSRRTEIEARLKELGTSGATASERAALATRQAKTHIDRDVLLSRWAATAEALAPGWRAEQCLERQHQREPTAMPTAQEIAAKLTEQSSVFRQRDVDRLTFEAAATAGLSLSQAREYSKNVINHPDVMKLTGPGREGVYSTKEMVALEAGVVARGTRMSHQYNHQVSDRQLAAALAKKPTLSDEQKAMVEHITKGGDLSLVQGDAGTGKSFALGAAREAWEAAGYRTRGTALSGKAAEGLQSGAGIESITTARLLMDARPWTDGRGTEHAARDPITAKDVIVVDEAGMLGSRQLDELTKLADEAKAKIVLVGDTKQLQAIDAGAPFRDLQDRLGAAKLQEVRRQKDAEDRRAVNDLGYRNAGPALENLESRGRVHVTNTAREAQKAAGQAVAQDTISGHQSLAITATRRDAAEVNRAAREAMREAGKLGQDVTIQTTEGDKNFATGDRILLTKNDQGLDVKNGDLGTVTDINKTHITVQLDREKSVIIDTAKYESVQHGYAITAHKSQGATVDRAHVVAGGSGMEGTEWAYVSNSRARDETHVHVDVTTKEEIAQTWNKSHQSESTQDFLQQPDQPEQQQQVEQEQQKEQSDVEQQTAEQQPEPTPEQPEQPEALSQAQEQQGIEQQAEQEQRQAQDVEQEREVEQQQDIEQPAVDVEQQQPEQHEQDVEQSHTEELAETATRAIDDRAAEAAEVVTGNKELEKENKELEKQDQAIEQPGEQPDQSVEQQQDVERSATEQEQQQAQPEQGQDQSADVEQAVEQQQDQGAEQDQAAPGVEEQRQELEQRQDQVIEQPPEQQWLGQAEPEKWIPDPEPASAEAVEQQQEQEREQQQERERFGEMEM